MVAINPCNVRTGTLASVDGTVTARTAEQSASATDDRYAASSEVKLSPALSLLQTIALAPVSFNAQSVSELQAAIQDGNYVVNPEAMADSMLSAAKEGLAHQKA